METADPDVAERFIRAFVPPEDLAAALTAAGIAPARSAAHPIDDDRLTLLGHELIRELFAPRGDH